jgi:L-lactate permease
MSTSYAIMGKGRAVICLTPLLDPAHIEQWSEGEEIIFKSSGMLTRHQVDEATLSLYHAIDFSVDRWIQDKQYVPRLLISAVVFTISYFIFSLAVRDPIPMIDELIISSGLAFVTWRSLTRRDSRSTVAQHRRQELKVRASERVQKTCQELFALEAYLDELSSFDSYVLSNALALVGETPLPDFTFEGDTALKKELSHLMSLYLSRYNKPLANVVQKVAQTQRDKHSDAKLAALLYHQAMQKGLDLPLVGLAVALL